MIKTKETLRLIIILIKEIKIPVLQLIQIRVLDNRHQQLTINKIETQIHPVVNNFKKCLQMEEKTNGKWEEDLKNILVNHQTEKLKM